ncbi:MAG TPA: hypothetical protein VIY28_05350 [Pseudonocardiaceae bacterium]
MADYDVLVTLAEQPDRGMRMAELADTILQPRSSLTRLIATCAASANGSSTTSARNSSTSSPKRGQLSIQR